MLIMPLGDIFIQTFSITEQEYSFLVSAYALAAAVSSIVGIFLLDRVDRKTGLLVLYTGFGIGTLLCGMVSTYAALLSLRVLTGLFGGMIGAMVLSITSDLYRFSERGKAMGVLFAAFSAASAFGVPIGIYLAAKGEWQLPFLVIGAFALVVATGVFFLFPSMQEHLAEQSEKLDIGSTISKIFKDNNQVTALGAGFVLVLAHFMIIPFISPYMIRNVGLTQTEIAYQFFFGGVATVFSAPFIGRMTDKHGVMKVFSIVLVLSWIPTVIITQLNVVPLALALTITTSFFVFASGRMISPNTIITAAASQENRGSFMSVKSALQQLAIGISSILGGIFIFIGDDGLFHNYSILAYLSIFFSLIAVVLIRKIRVAKGN